MKLGSLFDGSGGFPLGGIIAALLLGAMMAGAAVLVAMIFVM